MKNLIGKTMICELTDFAFFPLVLGSALGFLWVGRWVSLLLCSIAVGAFSVMIPILWRSFIEPWNSSHLIMFLIYLLLSLGFGGAAAIAASLSRFLKLGLKNKTPNPQKK